MEKYHFAKRFQENCEGSVIADAIKGADHMADLINFSIGDPDFNTDQEIIEQTFQDVKAGATHYTDSQGLLQLRELLGEFYAEAYNLKVTPEEIMITTSGCHAMVLALMAIFCLLYTSDAADE